MTGAMYAAVAGLKTHMSAMNVIGNNISNVNTYAYKATRYTFDESLYTAVRSGSNGTDQLGGRNPAQIGYGCSIGTIDLDMSTKNYNPTGKALDCMIDGDGFFIVGDNKENNGITKQSQLQGMSLTRLGRFNIDPQGYLVDGNGSLVYGYLRVTSLDDYCALTGKDPSAVTEEELTSPVLTPIRMPMCYVGEATPAGGTGGTGGTGTSHSTQKVKTTVYWPQVTPDDPTNPQEWYVEDVYYEPDPTTPDDPTLANTNLDTTATGFTAPGGTLTRLQPNSVSIDPTGCITAITKDEQAVVIGYIAIATVDNPDGVTHVDGRYFKALGGAGDVHASTIGGVFTYIAGSDDPRADATGAVPAGLPPLGGSQITAESSGDTQLVTGGLESSGTDLAQEISNMIMIQRGYQANTRIVTVTDSMLEELVNMKRG